jgi:hypothetical protein
MRIKMFNSLQEAKDDLRKNGSKYRKLATSPGLPHILKCSQPENKGKYFIIEPEKGL